MKLFLSSLAVVVSLYAVPACNTPNTETASVQVESGDATLSVYTVNYPLAYFAARIGGEHVEVGFPVPAGIDPAGWSPPVEAIAEYQAADLILLNGAGYARWVAKTTLDARKFVDTSASFHDRYIDLADAPTHAHGPDGEHAHTGLAFTLWLDPALATEQAKAVADAMSTASPAHETEFRDAFEKLAADIEELDERVAKSVGGNHRPDFMYSHPVYQYFERRYALRGPSFHWEPDVEPSQSDWRDLREKAGALSDPVMIWEAEPLASTRARLTEYGVRAVVYDPAANRPSSGDWLTVMQANVERMEVAFGSER